MENDEEELNPQENQPDEPDYQLCPVCADQGKEHGYETLKELARHYNFAHTGKNDPPYEESKKRIQHTSKKPKNLINAEQKPKAEKKVPSQQSKPQGVIMSDEEHIEPEIGEAAGIRGKIRQLVADIGKLPKERNSAMLPEREKLMEFMRVLTLKNLSVDTMHEIETQLIIIQTDIENMFDEAKKPSKKDGEDKDGTEQNLDLSMKKERLRSNIRKDLQTIADLPTELSETISAERDVLVELNRKLVRDDLTKSRIKDIEAQYTSFKPYINTAVKKSHKKRKSESTEWFDDDDDDDDDLDGLKDMKHRLKRIRYMRKLKEEQHALDKLDRSENNQSQQTPGNVIPVTRPRLNPETGDMILGENGQPIMDTTYQYASPSGMDPLMATMFQTMMMNMMNTNKNDGNSTERMMLEMKKEELEYRFKMLELEAKREQNNPANAEVKEMRAMNNQLQAQFYQTQLDNMQERLNNARMAASRDPLEEILVEKQRLMSLGLVSDPKASSQEQQSQEYAKEVLHEAKGTLDRTTHEMKELAQPLVEMNAQLMRKRIEKMDDEDIREGRQPQSNQPSALSQDEQKKKWGNILHAIDQSGE